MVNSLLIGKAISATLDSSQELKELVGSKIFPIIADNDTSFPFVVYKRTSLNSINLTKDGCTEDSVSYEFTIVSTKYNESVDIANEIRKVMERPKIVHPLMTLYNNRLIQSTEEYSDNCFIQKLIFQSNIN